MLKRKVIRKRADHLANIEYTIGSAVGGDLKTSKLELEVKLSELSMMPILTKTSQAIDMPDRPGFQPPGGCC